MPKKIPKFSAPLWHPSVGGFPMPRRRGVLGVVVALGAAYGGAWAVPRRWLLPAAATLAAAPANAQPAEEDVAMMQRLGSRVGWERLLGKMSQVGYSWMGEIMNDIPFFRTLFIFNESSWMGGILRMIFHFFGNDVFFIYPISMGDHPKKIFGSDGMYETFQ